MCFGGTAKGVSTLRGHTSAVLSVAVTKIGKREVGEQRQKKTKNTRKVTTTTASEEGVNHCQFWPVDGCRKLIQDDSTIPTKESSKTQVVSISPPTIIRFVFLQASQSAFVTLDERNIVCSFEVASGSLFASFEALSAGTITPACLCAPIHIIVVASCGGMVERTMSQVRSEPFEMFQKEEKVQKMKKTRK
ncbi:hypothetical protein BLNAU_3620 [Blattamonas nauphoetae]|uniref:Uncharacterized protein n=1 Tax=Blattamonas nauphoetae TaxID=2049346 RepID=A0ABQ9YCK6_9EUKA|nr:hypothetical protein BLNAU_3620 [Blattamonas nauphoetae]